MFILEPNYKNLSSKKIYLIRHGQTDFNLKGIVQGSGIDSSLNETGRRQASAFYNSYSNLPFDHVYTSALKRSIESVQSFLDNGSKHSALSGLNEINWGSKEGQNITPQEDAYYHWLLKEWQKGHTELPIEGGESPVDVAARQREAIEVIMQQADEKTVLVCMHGRAIRIILCQLLNYPLHAMDVFEHRNLGLYQLHYSGRMWQVERYNDATHLARM